MRRFAVLALVTMVLAVGCLNDTPPDPPFVWPAADESIVRPIGPTEQIKLPILNFTVTDENPIATKNLYVGNRGGGLASYEVTVEEPWVGLNPQVGTVGRIADVIEVTIDASSLAPGQHSATVTVRDTDPDPDALQAAQQLLILGIDYVEGFEVPVNVVVQSSRTYYVNDASTAGDSFCSNVGNDANDGRTPATPKATLNAVLSLEPEPGSQIYVDTGTFAEAVVYVTGSEGAPIIIKGAGPSNTFIETLLGSSAAMRLSMSQYVALRDMSFVSDNATGLHLQTSAGVSVFNCEFRQCGGNGLQINEGGGILVQACNFRDNGSHDIQATNVSNLTVQDSFVQRSSVSSVSDGILLSGCTDVTLRRLVLSRQNKGVALAQTTGVTAGELLIYDCRVAGIECNGTEDVTLVNNTLYRNGDAEVLLTSGCRDTRVYNNLLRAVGSSAYALNVSADSQSGFASGRNLFWSPDSENLVRWGSSTFKTAQEYSEAARETADTSSLSAAPLFVGIDVGDFHQAESSPTIDAGYNNAPGVGANDLDALTNPLGGIRRINNGDGDSESVIDIGAYEK